MKVRILNCIVGVMALAMASQAPAAGAGQPIDANTLVAMFSEHEYGDDTHFSYQFHGDGTFTGTEMGKEVAGRWRLRGSRMCWRWTRPPGAEECYEGRGNGAEISLYRNGVEQWFGTLKPIR